MHSGHRFRNVPLPCVQFSVTNEARVGGGPDPPTVRAPGTGLVSGRAAGPPDRRLARPRSGGRRAARATTRPPRHLRIRVTFSKVPFGIIFLTELSRREAHAADASPLGHVFGSPGGGPF